MNYLYYQLKLKNKTCQVYKTIKISNFIKFTNKAKALIIPLTEK